MFNKLILVSIISILLLSCGKEYVVPTIFTDDQSAVIVTKYPKECYYFLTIFCNNDDKYKYINPYTYNPGLQRIVTHDLLATYKNYSSSNSIFTKQTYYQIASNTFSNNTTAARHARNMLQNAIIGVSNSTISRHLGAIKATGTNVNLLFGGATAALTGLGSVAAEATSKAVTAAATGTNAGRSIFNEEVYNNNLVDTITYTIEAGLANKLIQIAYNQQRSIRDYDVEAAIRDALLYHENGSFYHGVDSLREAGERDIMRQYKAFSSYTTVKGKPNIILPTGFYMQSTK